MIGHDASQLVKPEQRHLCEQRALARDRLTHDHVERTDAVRRHHQDTVATDRIVVPHLAAGEEGEGGQLGGMDGVHLFVIPAKAGIQKCANREAQIISAVLVETVEDVTFGN